eukprot:2971017-Ditylum_brightwellii.AAC.1
MTKAATIPDSTVEKTTKVVTNHQDESCYLTIQKSKVALTKDPKKTNKTNCALKENGILEDSYGTFPKV